MKGKFFVDFTETRGKSSNTSKSPQKTFKAKKINNNNTSNANTNEKDPISQILDYRKKLSIGDEKISRREATEKNIPIYRASPKEFKGKKFEDFVTHDKS